MPVVYFYLLCTYYINQLCNNIFRLKRTLLIDTDEIKEELQAETPFIPLQTLTQKII